MVFLEEYKGEIELINREINRFFEEKERILASISGFNREFYENIKEFVLRGGKRLRPLSMVMAYKALGGSEEKIYRAAISVELLHNSTLIHDDIIDRDVIRRGAPTFHIKYYNQYRHVPDAEHFGLSIGILGGDATWNLGLDAILSAGFSPERTVKAVMLYQRAYEDVLNGVVFETYLAMRKRATLDEYLKMIELKTAALFEKSLIMGGVLAGCNDQRLEALSKYAISVGQAFQIWDDVLGTFGKEEETGKPSDSDIKEGKMTILVVKALELIDDDERRVLMSVLGNENASPEDIEEVRRIFKSCGALDSALKLANDLKERGKRELISRKEEFDSRYLEFFIKLADFVVRRKL
ncbi:MAG: polyprenyl synthetase family protein [Candidatus Baldrarchaeia archaeon]